MQRRDVTSLDGARRKKQVWRHMFEPEVFRKQICCIEESTCDIVGTFRRPRSHSAPPAVIWLPHGNWAPGELSPLAPRPYAPDAVHALQ